MIRSMKLIAIAATLAAAPAFAQSYNRVVNMPPDADSPGCTAGLCIDDVSIDTDQYTGWIMVEGFTKATIGTTYTDSNDSNTGINVTCQTSETPTTANGAGYDVCAGATSSGTTTFTCPHIWYLETGTAEKWNMTVDNLNAKYLNCKYSATGTTGALDDEVTVYVLRRTP